MKTYKSILLLLALAACSPMVEAQSTAPNILLIVDISHPEAVTFTATGNSPLVSDSSHSFFDGIDLTNFFSSDVEGILGPVPSTLTTSIDKSPFYDGGATDNYSEGGNASNPFEVPGRDLALFTDDETGANSETFALGSQAFIGSFALDLSPNPPVLPKSGYIGDIFAGYSADIPASDDDAQGVFALAQDLNDILPLLGQYEVIPEPSQWSLLLLGAGALLAARRFIFRKQA